MSMSSGVGEHPFGFSHDVKVVMHPPAFWKKNFLFITAEEIDSTDKLEKDSQKVLTAYLFNFIQSNVFFN